MLRFTRSLLFGLAVLLSVASTQAQTVARCGEGWLELVDDYPVLHLKGTHYEMGYQHGALMKDRIHSNLGNIVKVEGEKTVKVGPLEVKPRAVIGTIIEIQKPHVPKKYFDEMDGLAAGSEVSVDDVRVANFIPEMFHCSGFALMNSATKDGSLYHGRVLDYAINWGLQEHAVLVVAEPKDGIPFVNVTYAGFLGCVTGMNAKHVSIGEMGGGGLGSWDGVPMSILVRMALEQGTDLDSAVNVFKDNRRTCQYFYVVADGNTNRAVGMEASADRFEVVGSGKAHPLLPTPVKDCALLSAGDRYKELVKRVQDGHGKFTPESALRLMDLGVAMKSNLHNVLFEPKTTRLWIANATKDKAPAASQPYHAFQLSELLKRRPDMQSRDIPLEVKAAAR